MTGMQISRDYFESHALTALRRDFPALIGHLAAGLVGNGSECFGYDDEASRDHDWGADFFLWTDPESAGEIDRLTRWKEELMRCVPPTYVRKATPFALTPSVSTVGDFYKTLIGVPDRPQSTVEWLRIPEENLALAVNGAVFYDGPGLFTEVRGRLLAHYPEDVRRKKLSSCCMAIAQTGQYNYPRTVRRGDAVTASIILHRFAEQVMAMVFLLERTYRPYYKWQFRRLQELPLGRRIALLLRQLLAPWEAVPTRQEREELILAVTDTLCAELRRQELTSSDDWFLETHGLELLRSIQDPLLLSMPTYH